MKGRKGPLLPYFLLPNRRIEKRGRKKRRKGEGKEKKEKKKKKKKRRRVLLLLCCRLLLCCGAAAAVMRCCCCCAAVLLLLLLLRCGWLPLLLRCGWLLLLLLCGWLPLLSVPEKVKKCLLGRRQGEQGVLEDGARLLQELISSSDGKDYYSIRMFSVEEIEEAIEEAYSRISPNKEIEGAEETFETGIFSSNYKGIYQGRQIFIKAYREEREYAFNEIATITQINHANVVKLLGCCFEIEFPLLVYELVANSLCHRLHEPNPLGPIPWDYRLRIATEIANAITYLHIANPKPIVHRNIKSSNILLDEHCRPKLCGFTLTVTIPLGETHVKMEDISGTFGYLDPHYRVTSIVSAKTDVYSFGMLLFELLSGKIPAELITTDEEEKILWDMHGSCKSEEDEIIQLILDNGLSMDPRQVEQSVACTELVIRCIAREPDQRPPMKEVAQQLQLIERYELPSSSSSSSLAGVQQLRE